MVTSPPKMTTGGKGGFYSPIPHCATYHVRHISILWMFNLTPISCTILGTKVYEDRRAESVRMMDDSEAKKHKIEQAIEELNKRLKELEGEKEELTKYREEDKKRRSIEYAIYDKDYNAARGDVHPSSLLWFMHNLEFMVRFFSF